MISGGMNGMDMILGSVLLLLTLIFLLLAIISVTACGAAGPICATIFGFFAIGAFLGSLHAFFGKEKVDRFMDCIKWAVAKEIASMLAHKHLSREAIIFLAISSIVKVTVCANDILFGKYTEGSDYILEVGNIV